jgi:hypothetical protein
MAACDYSLPVHCAAQHREQAHEALHISDGHIVNHKTRNQNLILSQLGRPISRLGAKFSHCPSPTISTGVAREPLHRHSFASAVSDTKMASLEYVLNGLQV